MRRSAFISTASALALFAAGSAAAQDAAPLRLGQTVSGQLTAEDMKVDGEELGQFVYDTYSIQARQGQRLEVTMRSDAFDTYLEAYQGADQGEPVAADDDGLGEGTNSRLRFVAGQNGVYTIRARTLAGLEGGDYTIQATDRGPAPRAPRPTGIRLGQTRDGALSDRSPTDDDGAFDGYAYNAYSFRARQGERVVVTLDSEDFDPIVRVGRMGPGGVFEELAQNDDGPSGMNSRLVFTAPANGEYLIRASSLDGATDGDYALSLAEGPPLLVGQPITLGQTVEGALEDGDSSNDDGQRADAYSFAGTEGQRVTITLSSDAFDTYLELFGDDAESGGGRSLLASDDDGAGEGTNSRLSATLPTTGQYTIEVRAFGGADEGGAYTLTLEEAPPLPAPTPLTFGETVQGEIVEADPRDDENRGFDAYSFTGVEGNRIQLTMRSGDFDTFLQIGSAEGEFYALASDDDGLGEGTDSRLNYILPNDGAFIVRASPLYADADGLYSLELTDRGPQPLPGSILVGATARGTLTDEDAIADDGSFYDAYKITVKAGEKLRLTMVSNDFDAFIDIGQEDESGTFTSVVSDDDSLSDTHAKIDWSVEEEGDYVIRARSYASGQEGAYALTVEPRD